MSSTGGNKKRRRSGANKEGNTSADDGDNSFIAFSTAKESTGQKKKTIHPMLVTDCFVPWLQFSAVDTKVSPLVRLHNEILSFCEYCAPTKHELEVRQTALADISHVIHEVYPKSTVEVFGSQLTKILTPTSDLDIAMLNVEDECMETEPLEPLFKVAEALTRKGIVSYVEVISNAKVPIIKLDHAATGIPFDICLNNTSGLDTGRFIRKYVTEFPQLRPLAITLKIYLSQRKLNEVYSGGIGSFMLCNMLISFLQMRRRIEAHTGIVQSWNLGSLLLDFFDLYGNTLNFYHVGISLRNDGMYFAKRRVGAESSKGKDKNKEGKGKSSSSSSSSSSAAAAASDTATSTSIVSGGDWVHASRQHLLAIENPLLPEVDMGRGSFMIGKIRRAFDHARQVLTTALTEYAGGSNSGGSSSSGSSGDDDKADYFGFLSFVIRPDDAVLASRAEILLAENAAEVRRANANKKLGGSEDGDSGSEGNSGGVSDENDGSSSDSGSDGDGDSGEAPTAAGHGYGRRRSHRDQLQGGAAGRRGAAAGGQHQPGLGAFFRSNFHALFDDDETLVPSVKVGAGDRMDAGSGGEARAGAAASEAASSAAGEGSDCERGDTSSSTPQAALKAPPSAVAEAKLDMDAGINDAKLSKSQAKRFAKRAKRLQQDEEHPHLRGMGKVERKLELARLEKVKRAEKKERDLVSAERVFSSNSNSSGAASVGSDDDDNDDDDEGGGRGGAAAEEESDTDTERGKPAKKMKRSKSDTSISSTSSGRSKKEKNKDKSGKPSSSYAYMM